MPQSSQTEKRRVRGPGGQTPEQILLRFTDRSGDCWLWLGRKNPNGYAQIVIAKHQRSAHRVSYETFVGPIPEGLQLDHLCRVRHCVNPAHLEPVTGAENIRRAIAATGMVAGKRVGGLELGEKCPSGHVVDADNHYVRRGLIRCLSCRREQNRRSMAKGRPRQRSYTDHAKVAAAARAAQGEWVSVATYRTVDTAYTIVYGIRRGKVLPSYAPAGSFEAEKRRVDGGFEVFARFIGSQAPTEQTTVFVDCEGDVWVPDGIDPVTREQRLACPKPQNPADAGDGDSYPWTLSEVRHLFGPLTEQTAVQA